MVERLILIGCCFLFVSGVVFISYKLYRHRFISSYNGRRTSLTDRLAGVSWEEADNLMIVAHPDDETIWGGGLLLQGNWLVVCITYDNDSLRGQEFFSVMRESGNTGVMLGYPDISDGQRDDWRTAKRDIQEDLQYLIGLKQWSKVVTHNPDGEYRHQQHILTSRWVTCLMKRSRRLAALFYFGKYYSAKEVQTIPILPIAPSLFVQKQHLLDFYTSQAVSKNALGHMFSFEQLIPYSDWKHYKSDAFTLLKAQFSQERLRESIHTCKRKLFQ